jgi:hypothetical protein
MTLAQAEDILGPRAKSSWDGVPEWFDPAAWINLYSPYWKKDGCLVMLYLDDPGPEGRVIWGEFKSDHASMRLSEEPTLWERLRSRLPW